MLKRKDDVPVEHVLAFLERIAQDPKPPSEVADIVFRAIADRRFYILTHPEYNDYIRSRFEAILDGRAPSGQVE